MIRSGFVVAVFVLTFAGWGSVDSERHAAEVALGNGDMMAPLMAPSGDCYQCRDCVGDKHDIVEGLPENNKWESSHLETCNPGDCDLPDECGVTLAQLNEIWISGQEAALPTLQELSSEMEYVHLNLERGALQILGCTGNVVASLPLRAGQLVDR